MFNLDLNQIGVLEGTDKSSSVAAKWDYLRHYEGWFAKWKDKEINIIEIGVANGNSLHVWEEFFPNAKLIGIDVQQKCSIYANKRIFIEIWSQDDPNFLHYVCAKYPPTIIIDDGSHKAHHIIYTFEHMFPLLLSGGVYIVEDLEFHFGEQSAKHRPIESYDPPTYFLDLARSCMTLQNRSDLWGTNRSIVQSTDSVRFINSAICIQKKSDRKPSSKRTCSKRVYGQQKPWQNCALKILFIYG